MDFEPLAMIMRKHDLTATSNKFGDDHPRYSGLTDVSTVLADYKIILSDGDTLMDEGAVNTIRKTGMLMQGRYYFTCINNYGVS